MNILPKKRWHVRTRENIARVRRDEAKAAEEERQKQLRIEIAEREARTELLRKKGREKFSGGYIDEDRIQNELPKAEEHVNLFYEVEHNSFATDKTNAEYEKEKKLEREKYEKQIGYLTYLGQDTNEITGNVSWYNRDPEERNNITQEVSKGIKALEDPLTDIRKYLGSKGVQKIVQGSEMLGEKANVESNIKSEYFSEFSHLQKHSKRLKKKKAKEKKKKKKRKYSSDSDVTQSTKPYDSKKMNLEILRKERLKRETEERKRAQLVLEKLTGNIKEEKVSSPEIEQKYNSQFNPHLAKQNFLKY